MIYEEVWLVKFKSYAKATSPAAVKFVGNAFVIVVLLTEKISDALSWMLKILPVIGAVVPILIFTRLPVKVGTPEGDQSTESSLPLDKLVDVELTYSPVPVVNELASKVTAVTLVAVETTCRFELGPVVPIPTFPLSRITNLSA